MEPQKEIPLAIALHSLFPQSLETTNLHSSSMDLPIWMFHIVEYYAICGICVWLLSFRVIISSKFIYFVTCVSAPFLL